MNRVVTSRAATLMTVVILVAIPACSDDGSRANLTGPSASLAGGSPADSARNGGGNPPTGHPDTGVTTNPAPKPAASFTLVVHVGTPRPGATDTLTTDPIAGATVAVFGQTVTPGTQQGADTLTISQTLIASGSSDASGNFAVPKLNGASVYLIKVAPPAGSNLSSGSMIISQVSVDSVTVPITLFGR